MAMNLPSLTNGQDEPEVMMDINTTPLIDVMLVLLIMLIITIPVQLHSVNLDMPQSATPQTKKPAVGLEHPQDKARCQHPYDGEKPALPTARTRQKRERRAAVVYAHQIEKAGDSVAVAPLVEAQNQHFGELVGYQNDQRQPQPLQHAAAASDGFEAGFGGGTAGLARHQATVRASPAPNRLLVQRPQIVGCAGSAPTSSR